MFIVPQSLLFARFSAYSCVPDSLEADRYGAAHKLRYTVYAFNERRALFLPRKSGAKKNNVRLKTMINEVPGRYARRFGE